MHAARDTSGDSKRESPAFKIDKRKLADQTGVLGVTGELDLATAPELKWALADLQTEGSLNLIVDLSQISFIDSTALGVLVGAQRGLDVGARLVLICAEENVLRIFELTGLDGMFDIFATIEEALAFTHDGAAVSPR
jgi:anti-sigma B factor antagonist